MHPPQVECRQGQMDDGFVDSRCGGRSYACADPLPPRRHGKWAHKVRHRLLTFLCRLPLYLHGGRWFTGTSATGTLGVEDGFGVCNRHWARRVRDWSLPCHRALWSYSLPDVHICDVRGARSKLLALTCRNRLVSLVLGLPFNLFSCKLAQHA